MGEALSRILDPSALAACDKPRGRLLIEVPRGWQGAEIEIALPARLACARCDGGGCDGCERRGGHHIPGEPGAPARLVRLRLPADLSGGVVLRVLRPFDDDDGGGIAQLLLEARIGEGASACVTMCALAAPPPATHLSAVTRRAAKLAPPTIAAYAALALAAASILALAFGR